jgi:hypothetical protein
LLLSWFLGALLIDGLFGATKWVVRFQATYSTIALWQLGWVRAAHDIVDRLKNRPWGVRLPVLCAAIAMWIFANHVTLGFDIKPVSVFVNHSDIRLMRQNDSALPLDAKIYNMRPPGNPFGWGEFCAGELWRSCWNHGYGRHEIASGNERGEKQHLCEPTDSSFVACLKGQGFQYILLVSRANSSAYSGELIKQGATMFDQIESSYLLKVN